MSKSKNLKQKLTIAISSRALFELEEENKIYEKKGDEAYYRYQIENEAKILKPGTAFPLIKDFLELNRKYVERQYKDSLKNGQKKQKQISTSETNNDFIDFMEEHRLIEVIIVSRNRAEAGIRIFKSIKEYKLDIKKAAFLGGDARSGYLKAFDVDLFLSREEGDVLAAINDNIPAAMLYNPPLSRPMNNNNANNNASSDSIRIALDCDGVIFSEEGERIFQKEKMSGFVEHELKNAKKKLADGPFARFVRSIALMQKDYAMHERPIKLAIVTSRSGEAQERVIRTLRTWEVPINCAFFLGNKDKKPILDVFKPHIYFDDQSRHLVKTSKGTPSGEVFWKENSSKKTQENSSPQRNKRKKPSSIKKILSPPTPPKEIKDLGFPEKRQK